WDLTSDLSSYDGSDGGTGDTTTNGGTTAYSKNEDTATMQVTNVNKAPSFNPGANQKVSEDAAPQSVANWATGISAGDKNEDVVQKVHFVVTVPSGSASLFSVAPAVDTNGTLTYTLAPNANTFDPTTGLNPGVVLAVVAKDDGGTANGGT